MSRVLSGLLRFSIAVLSASVGLVAPVFSQDLPGERLEERVAEEYKWMLRDDEVRSRIIGVGEEGVPMLCGTRARDLRPSTGQTVKTRSEEGYLAWELVPGVVSADGSERFHVRVQINQVGVEKVFLTLQENRSAIVAPEGESRDQVLLRDNGEGNDGTAGDNVYTSKSLQVDTTGALLTSAYRDLITGEEFRAESLFEEEMEIVVEKTDGSALEDFIERPRLLIMETQAHDPGPINAFDSIQVSDHVVNLKGGFKVQEGLRGLDLVRSEYAQRIYDHVKDKYEFIAFMSSNHLEIVPDPKAQSPNFRTGEHKWVQVDYEGTGLVTFDDSDSFGSAGELLGASLLDVFGRGLQANNTTHEILHQWAAHIPGSLGLTDGTAGAHYDAESSVKSLLGGVKWTENADGTFEADCTVGRGGAYTASQLDLYMMGLVPGSEMDTLWAVADGRYPEYCTVARGGVGDGSSVEPREIQDTVSIENVQEAVGGPREPGPGSARRDYRILFAVESNGRLLTEQEMAFYDLLAQHYTSSTAEGGYMGINHWNPVEPYFRGETTWSSEVDAFAPLPVDLASFDARTRGGKVQLTWHTASEQNNAGFEVQRKPAGNRSPWTQVGFVEGAGTTSKPQSYRLTDANLPYEANKLRYRLKQVDTDGTARIFGRETIRRRAEELELLAPSPNPARQQATVRYAVPERQEIRLTLYDMLGRELRTVVRTEKEGRHERHVDVSELSSGTYFLRLKTDRAEKSRRLTVVR